MGVAGKVGGAVKQKAGQIFNKPIEPNEPSIPYAAPPKETDADLAASKEKERAGMPLLKRIAAQSGLSDKTFSQPEKFLAIGEDPKWKPGQTVNYHGINGLRVFKKEPNGYILQKVSPKGSLQTFKFNPKFGQLIPDKHPAGSEKFFPNAKKIG